MKAVIIDTFNNYEPRTKYVGEHLTALGYDVTFITSDFSHALKKKVVIERENTVAIDTKPYKKNLSVSRIRSHLDFSKKAHALLCDIKPQLIYCLVPLNSLVKTVHKYARKNDGVTVYFDVFDLWPESMPAPGALKKLLKSWKNMRDKHLGCAKTVFTECAYYRRLLPAGPQYVTAYLCKSARPVQNAAAEDGGELNFLYLGSINNLIDIDGTVGLLSAVKAVRPVRLTIIGGGGAHDELVRRLGEAGVPVDDRGVVFDDEQKDDIISGCHFGLNMYKSGLAIGLTMKSIEYFCRGLPVVSRNISDTAEIIDKYGCGVNIGADGDPGALMSIGAQEYARMVEACKSAHKELFDEQSYKELLAKCIPPRESE